MFNLNLATTAANAVNNLLVDSTCTTPRTPEILNSLIAMTNPLDNYSFVNNTTTTKTTSCTTLSTIPSMMNMSSDSNSSTSSQLESPTTTTTTTTNPPSVQHTCSQLIKAGLKLSIEQKKRKYYYQNDGNGSSGGEDLLDLDKCSKRIKKHECSESEDDRNNKQDGLTPEDEERRRRRRERNKIAATKCRLKKREKTANLINESETLETQNIDLKQQLHELQNQKRTLMEMLTLHRPHCQHNIAQATRDTIYRSPTTIIDNHSNVTTKTTTPPTTTTTPTQQQQQQQQQQQNIEINNYNHHHHHHHRQLQDVVTSSGIVANMTYTRPTYTTKPPPPVPPSIIVEDMNDYHHTPHLTNLDNPINNYHYNNQCHSYNSNQNYNTTTGLDNGCMA